MQQKKLPNRLQNDVICQFKGNAKIGQSWPKISGQIPKLNTKYLPAPRQCCQVAVFMYSPIDFSGFQHCLGEGGLPKIRNDGTTKLKSTGYRYREHKCTLQSLFSYLSQKILARIVVLVDLQNSRSLDGSCVLHAGLSRLRQLTLTGTSVTDAILSKILEASSGLQTLHLAGTRISNKCLPQMTGLKNLQYISVPSEDVHGFGRGAAIAIVENCMALQTFDCQEGYFFSTMEIYRIIDCNPNLTSLLIPYSFVDDITLPFIIGNLQKLTYLCVCETKVTQGCVQRMRAWKPHLEI